MSLTQRTSPRKNLSLYTKKNHDEIESKRAKLDDPDLLNVCRQVSYEAFHDFKKRFQILHLPECNSNMCTHGIKKISAAAEGLIKIDMGNLEWFEALESCTLCLTAGQCLSSSVLKDIVNIIMNAHEDVFSGYTIEHILRKCQHVLFLNFNTHPPCFQNSVRACYKEFLIPQLPVQEEIPLKNRQEYCSKKGIVAYCFERLKYEMCIESEDEAQVDKKSIPNEFGEVQKLHWKKANHEVFEYLDRTVRIQRLMLVLESVIDLLQIDLALWHIRYYKLASDSRTRSTKPLLTYILWPGNSLNCDTVSRLCLQIMELFAYFIHLKYPEEHIKTMSLWMNTTVQMIYSNDNITYREYPSVSAKYSSFCNKFVAIISNLPTTTVLKILERLHPTFMRHLVGNCYIQTVLQTSEKDIMLTMTSYIQGTLRVNFLDGQTFVSPKRVNGRTKVPQSVRKSRATQSCEISAETDTELCNPYPRLELEMMKEDHISKMERKTFVGILCATLIAYLESYNIKEFHRRYYAESKNEWDLNLFNNFSVSKNFMEKYRDINKFLQDLRIILEQRKNNGDEVIISKLQKYLKK